MSDNTLEKSVTIVSAYYCIKSKHKPQQYDVWIRNLLLGVGRFCKMVIFTSPDLVDYMNATCKQNTRGALFTVIGIPMKDFKLLKRYPLKIWAHQYSMDPQKACGRTVECYLIWNSKLIFMKEAMERNVYGSDKYAWIDIGSFRTADTTILEHFPVYERVSEDKIDIMLIRPYLPHEMNQLIFFNTVHLGGMFGGSIASINKLFQLFYKAFDIYITGKQFAGCDQQILSTCYMRSPELFNLVTKTQDSDVNDTWNVWFYLYKYWNLEKLN
jgi:hypothetical protein